MSAYNQIVPIHVEIAIVCLRYNKACLIGLHPSGSATLLSAKITVLLFQPVLIYFLKETYSSSYAAMDSLKINTARFDTAYSYANG